MEKIVLPEMSFSWPAMEIKTPKATKKGGLQFQKEAVITGHERVLLQAVEKTISYNGRCNKK